jgi:hypothetical protein
MTPPTGHDESFYGDMGTSTDLMRWIPGGTFLMGSEARGRSPSDTRRRGRRKLSGSRRRGTMRAPSATTLREVWETWLAVAGDGTIRNRSRDSYKPSVLRGYATSMRLRVSAGCEGASRTSDPAGGKEPRAAVLENNVRRLI